MEEKITYTGVTFSTNLLLFLHESILSSQLQKENKNYMKENKNPKLQTTNSVSYTHLTLPTIYSV